MPYLGWFDDDAKRSLTQKIQAGAAAYQERFGVAARVVLVSASAAQEIGTALGSLVIRPESYIRPNNFWFGEE